MTKKTKSMITRGFNIMLIMVPGKFKQIFNEVAETRKKLIRSGGLVPFRMFIIKSGLIEFFERFLKDKRNQTRIKYPISELLNNIILRILDGEKRIYQFRYSVNEYFYSAISSAKTSPHFNTFRYLILKNPALSRILMKILLRFSLKDLKNRIENGTIKSITVDVDQTGRELHGKQEGVKEGYFASGKGKKGYQIQLWTIREIKTVFKAELRSGNTYSGKGFFKDMRYLLKLLKPLGIPIFVVADSGYENKQVFKLLNDNGVSFIIAEKQRKAVKIRGKWAKNKRTLFAEGVIFKSRNTKVEINKQEYTFREIFVYASKVKDEKGQYYFPEMFRDDFTNVFMTNLDKSAQEIYELYKDHAQVETIIEELKNDFGLGYSCNETFAFNQAMTQLIALAYNLKTMYLLEMNNSQVKERLPRMSTVRNELIHIPAMMVNERNRSVIKFSKNGLKVLRPFFVRLGFKVA